jgi:hypothetical protein
VRDTALPAPYRGAATVAIILLGLAIPLSFLLSRVLAQTFRPMSWVVFTWMGTLLLLFLTLVSLDLVRAIYLAAHRVFSDPLTDERRAFLGQLFGGAAAFTAASLGGIALRLGLRPPSIRKVEVPLRRLPRAHDGTTIVQLTDLHIGPTIDGAWLREVVRRTNALEPDLVAITGDLVDGSVEAMGPAVAERLSIPHLTGVVAARVVERAVLAQRWADGALRSYRAPLPVVLDHWLLPPLPPAPPAPP